MPFFVVATSAPLLQRWFASAKLGQSGNPYALYAASNAGSLIALLGYPLFVEPFFSTRQQGWYWMVGYLLYVVMAIACAIGVRNRLVSTDEPGSEASSGAADNAVPGVAWKDRLYWVLYSMVPSSLMLGVTVHITTDITPMPLFWVIPLAIYLLTFILVFAGRPPIPRRIMLQLMPFAVLVVAPMFFLPFPRYPWLLMAVELMVFFVVAMVCHGELSHRKPHPKHLTEYYIWLAFGGMCGGIFNAILAPVLFSNVLEYPLMVLAACLLRPWRFGGSARRPWIGYDLLLPVAVIAAGAALDPLLERWCDAGMDMRLYVLWAFVAIVCLAFRNQSLRFGLAYGAALLLFVLFVHNHSGNNLVTQRNFFGVKRVFADPLNGMRTLMHGTTVHGIQRSEPEWSHEPLTYFHREGPFGDLFAALQRKADSQIGIVGLGVGALASYAKPGWHYDYFEIDPQMVSIATDPRYFTLIQNSAAQIRMVVGDGRLCLDREPDRRYDLLVLDAYSSDTIPAHLLTLESLRLYESKIREHGVLAFHVTNRFFDLGPLLADEARELGLVGLAYPPGNLTQQAWALGGQPAYVIVLAHRKEDLLRLGLGPQWKELSSHGGRLLWTDDRWSVLSMYIHLLGKR